MSSHSPKSISPGCYGGKPTGDCPPKVEGALDSYGAIVRDYVKRYRDRFEANLRFYAELPSLEEAVKQAALGKRPDGKRNSHQRRIPQESLQASARRLRRCNLAAGESFHQLWEQVNDKIRGIDRIGELTIYDTAHRIGAFLKLHPELVYLHAGARIGAATLGIPKPTAWAAPTDLPKPFHKLTPAQMEDCLCIYKERLKAIQAAKR
ncbi:hypothetical protein [Bremerella cremea]|uniref:hypothetical protein n=1 Tax=Bremerella cremea TaxID=1031537 RepID=UPI0031F038E6